MRPLLLPLVLLVACSDYNLSSQADPTEGKDGDETCMVEVAAAGSVPVDATCLAPDVEVEDPWNAEIKWQWTGLSTNTSVRNVIMTPVVGNLTDTNADGVIDTDDVPNVIFTAFPSTSFGTGTLVVLDGATGDEVWTEPGYSGVGGVALGDMDGDGVADILAFDGSRRPVAVSGATGERLWTSTVSVSSMYPQATVADVDGDGVPEVLADNLMLDGATGDVLRSFFVGGGIPYHMPTAGDISLDGVQEVIVGNTVYDPLTGTAQWSAPFSGGYGHWTAILQADEDPEGEVLMIGGDRIGLFDHDGTQKMLLTGGSIANTPGPPCVADFTGDGEVNFAFANQNVLRVYHLDGSVAWSQAVDDFSGLAACSGYDVDGDGAYEVIYADERVFYIFDGRTGEVRYSQGGHASGTLWEYPAIADIDNDGSAEIVIASNNYSLSGWAGVTAFGHVNDGWLKSGNNWPTHDYSVTNMNDDGTVPADPEPPWLVHNVYRARPSVNDAMTDLQVAITDVCFGGCSDRAQVQVAVQVSNVGGTGAQSDIPVALYRNDGGTLTLVEVQVLHTALGSGESAPGLVFELEMSEYGSDGLVVRVDDDGTGSGIQMECDETNNEDFWAEQPC